MEFPQDAFNHEKPRNVFMALLGELSFYKQDAWLQRYNEAEAAERAMREYNREYDESLLTVSRGGQ